MSLFVYKVQAHRNVYTYIFYSLNYGRKSMSHEISHSIIMRSIQLVADITLHSDLIKVKSKSISRSLASRNAAAKPRYGETKKNPYISDLYTRGCATGALLKYISLSQRLKYGLDSRNDFPAVPHRPLP